MEKNYTQWFDETIESLEGMKRAEAPPYFHSKLMNRINSIHETDRFSKTWFPILNLKYMIGILGFVFLMNSLFFIYQFRKNLTSIDKPSIESFSKEFNLSSGSN